MTMLGACSGVGCSRVCVLVDAAVNLFVPLLPLYPPTISFSIMPPPKHYFQVNYHCLYLKKARIEKNMRLLRAEPLRVKTHC